MVKEYAIFVANGVVLTMAFPNNIISVLLGAAVLTTLILWRDTKWKK